jgi:hypothetical protein
MKKLIHSSPSTQLAIGNVLRSAVERDISDLQHEIEEDEVSPKTYHTIKTASSRFLSLNPEFKSSFNDFLSIATRGNKGDIGVKREIEGKISIPWRYYG